MEAPSKKSDGRKWLLVGGKCDVHATFHSQKELTSNEFIPFILYWPIAIFYLLYDFIFFFKKICTFKCLSFEMRNMHVGASLLFRSPNALSEQINICKTLFSNNNDGNKFAINFQVFNGLYVNAFVYAIPFHTLSIQYFFKPRRTHIHTYHLKTKVKHEVGRIFGAKQSVIECNRICNSIVGLVFLAVLSINECLLGVRSTLFKFGRIDETNKETNTDDEINKLCSHQR